MNCRAENMAAKLFRSRSSSCGALRFHAAIVSCMMILIHFLPSQCGATTSHTLKTARVDSEAQPERPMAKDLAPKLLCVYTITTVTGKKFGAGTDSTISLRLYNNASQSVYFPSLDNRNNNFEKGKVDKFLETGDCVNHVCKMALYTDNSGFMPSWFVDSLGVSVATPTAGVETITWQLHEWLPRDDSTAALFDLRDNCV